MASKKKLLQAAAGSAGGAGLDVDEVFSTFLYEGNNTFGPHTITNGIDLSGEDGLVWIKSRDSASSHGLYDTERGATKYLQSNATSAEATVSLGLTSFNSNGFNVDYSHYADSHVSWTFRKAEKFFDIVTWSGNGSNRDISHNLGSEPGMIWIKKRSGSGDWVVYHKFMNGGTNANQYYLQLNEANAQIGDGSTFNNTSPTPTVFTIGTHNDVNQSGETYVAYLFADNTNDGEFGPDSDQNIIKCGSYDADGTTDGSNEITLGFEPQFIFLKRYDSGGYYSQIIDNARGMVSGGNDSLIWSNVSGAEVTSINSVDVTATGFSVNDSGNSNLNNSNWIYMAIRRGPLAAPTDATKVFSVNEGGTGDNPTNVWNTGFSPDFNINTKTDGSATYLINRLTNKYLHAHDAAAEQSASSVKWFTGPSETLNLNTNWWGVGSNVISYSWKRAPGYFDVVTYTGTGSARTVAHNLGVAPEMMWVKCRSAATNWGVYTGDNTDYMILSANSASQDNANFWNDTSPTSSVFTLGSENDVNKVDRTFIAYLFATVAGVSKVGSYTGTGSSQNIDCGFSSGARFVLIKRYDDSGVWYLWDTTRGITSGNDPYLLLNLTNAEVTNTDYIDPHSSGFNISSNAPDAMNQSGGTYIFYAIA